MSALHKISTSVGGDRVADVLFLHGLGGDAFSTWRYDNDQSTSWPHWLAAEFPNVCFWSLGYAASPSNRINGLRKWISGDRDAGHAMPLPDRAREVVDLMVQHQLGSRPLLLIGHSLGGLLAKQILRRASDDSRDDHHRILTNTKSVLFLGTPHGGASLASLANRFRVIFGPTASMEDLKAHDAHLGDLFDWYRNHSVRANIETVTYFEDRDVFGFRIVDRTSSHPGVGPDPVGLDEDHISISKPRDQNQHVVNKVRELIRRVTRGTSGSNSVRDYSDEERKAFRAGNPPHGDSPPKSETQHNPVGEARGQSTALSSLPNVDEQMIVDISSSGNRNPLKLEVGEATAASTDRPSVEQLASAKSTREVGDTRSFSAPEPAPSETADHEALFLTISLFEQAVTVATDLLHSQFKTSDEKDADELLKIGDRLPKARQELERATRELMAEKVKYAKTLKKGQEARSVREKANEQRIKQDEVDRLERRKEALTGERAFDIGATAADIRAHVKDSLATTARWAQQISFLDANRSRDLDSIYIHLDIYVYPRRIRSTLEERADTVQLDGLLRHTSNHIILLGQPGAGKTTSMKRLFAIFYASVRERDEARLPIVIRLRELNSLPDCDTTASAGLVHCALLRAIKLTPNFGEKLSRDEFQGEVRDHRRTLITTLLDELRAIVILDGFDELAVSKRDPVLQEIRSLALALRQARLFVTSRGGEFNYDVECADQFEIAPLQVAQISEFAKRWLQNKDRARDFVGQVQSSPFSDAAIRPLSLAHLCAIYERSGSIPNKPRAVYRKVISLLLTEWDEQRSVVRSSVFEGFTEDQKQNFLAALAYYLTSRLETTSFDSAKLRLAYEEIHSIVGLPPGATRRVIDELESHTGLFLKTGDDQFEFAHKSLQEYLAATYIVRLPNIIENPAHLLRLPNELAITVSISSDSGSYLSALVLDVFARTKLPREFYDIFIDRICLEHPDFISNADTAIALYVLVSLWASKGGASNAKSRPVPVPGHILQRFCDQWGAIFRQSGLRTVNQYFRLELNRKDEGEFSEFERIKQPHELRLPTRLFIPKMLADLTFG